MKYEKMKKIFLLIVNALMGASLLLLVLTLLQIFKKNLYITIGIRWVFLLYALLLLIFILYTMLFVIKVGMNNTGKSDVPIFDELDEYKRSWGESNEHYLYLIQVIKLYNLKSNKVDKIVENRQIEDLYKRYDSLKNRNTSHEHIIIYFSNSFLLLFTY